MSVPSQTPENSQKVRGRRNGMGKPEARKVATPWEVGSRRGEVGLAESALPASPSSQKGLSERPGHVLHEA
eukprot:2662133-Pyramimonas_sp.AAC.1